MSTEGKPKLLIGTDNYEPRWDGISRFLSVIVPSLVDEYDITVLAPAFAGKKYPIKGVKVIRFPVASFRVGDFFPVIPSYSMIRQIQKEVRKCDLVWTNTIGPIGTMTLRTADKYRKPLASFVHSIEWNLVRMAMAKHNLMRRPTRLLTKIVAKNLYNRCDRIMVPSLEVLEIMDVNGIIPKKVVVPLGTDTKVFKPAQDKGLAKKEIGIDPSKKVVGYVGRIAREKDIVTLIRAFLRLKSKRDDVVLLLVGDGVSDYDKTIQAHKEIIAVGKQNKVYKYLQAMDVYVLPSLLETSSLSTMEAMACGVPVVCTPVGLVRNYVEEKVNGMFFRKGNSTVLSLKLNWLLSQPLTMIEMGIRARSTVVGMVDWVSTIEKVKKTLASLPVRHKN